MNAFFEMTEPLESQQVGQVCVMQGTLHRRKRECHRCLNSLASKSTFKVVHIFALFTRNTSSNFFA